MKARTAWFFLNIFFLILFGASPRGADAEGLTVRPIRIDLSDDQQNDAVTVTNQEDASQLLRVDAVSWDQSTGDDVYTPNADADLFLVPPILHLEPGESRVARLGLRRNAPGTRERAYRIFITEVPPTVDSGPSVNFAFRIGIPVFVTSGKPTQAQPIWKAQLDGAKHIHLTASNPGDTHVRIDAVHAYADASKKQLLAEEEKREYLLAGATRSFDIDLATASAPAFLAVDGVDTNDVPFSALVPVAPAVAAVGNAVR